MLSRLAFLKTALSTICAIPIVALAQAPKPKRQLVFSEEQKLWMKKVQESGKLYRKQLEEVSKQAIPTSNYDEPYKGPRLEPDTIGPGDMVIYNANMSPESMREFQENTRIFVSLPDGTETLIWPKK